MHKNEAAAKIGEGINVKFVATLVPPLIYIWKFDKDGKPNHMKKAFDLGLLVENTFAAKEGVRIGRAKVKDGELVLTSGSLDFSQNMPSQEEFQTLINGDVQVI